MAAPRLCLGVIVGAHGLKGQVKVKSFTEDPEALASYGPLTDETGSRSFELSVVGRAKGTLLATIAGVRDRTQAEALRGTELFVERHALPDTGDEEAYYHADLIGLAVEDQAGQPLGRVVALYDHGAGDLIEIAPEGSGPAILLPFTRAVVPLIDLENGRLVAAPPEETEAKPEKDEKAPHG